MASERRLIDADALIKSMREEDLLYPGVPWSTTGVQKQIDKLPTVDAVEVVRCVECDHLRSGRNNFGVFFWCGNAAGLTNIYDPYKDYCPRGERRAEDDEND